MGAALPHRMLGVAVALETGLIHDGGRQLVELLLMAVFRVIHVRLPRAVTRLAPLFRGGGTSNLRIAVRRAVEALSVVADETGVATHVAVLGWRGRRRRCLRGSWCLRGGWFLNSSLR